MATGAVWMVLAKLVDRSIGVVSMLILARVLIPHDFGIVAMAMSYVALLELLSAFGFDITLIQKQTKERGHWDTAWTFNVLLGLLVAAIMVAGAKPVASFFKEPGLTEVIGVLAIGSIAQGFQNIGLVAFRTEMRFDREFWFLTVKKLIGFVITVPLAIWLDSYWALVIGQTVSRVGSTALSFWVHPYRPRISFAASRDLFHFSKWLLIVNVISFLKERSPDWVIGRLAGPAALGTFSIAYELASLPSTELAAPINRAVFPAYARLAREEPSQLRAEYLSVIAMIVLLAVPAIFGLAATAALLVPVMLGPQWVDAGPVLVLLAFFGLTHIVQSNVQAVYLALGRADIPAKVNALHVAVQTVCLIPLITYYGVIGAAIAYLVTATIMIPASLGVALRLLHISVGTFVKEIWRPVLAAAAMYLLVRALLERNGAMHGVISDVIQLAAAVVVGAVAYVIAVVGLWLLMGSPAGAERVVLGRVRFVVSRYLLRRRSPA